MQPLLSPSPAALRQPSPGVAMAMPNTLAMLHSFTVSRPVAATLPGSAALTRGIATEVSGRTRMSVKVLQSPITPSQAPITLSAPSFYQGFLKFCFWLLLCGFYLF